MAINFEPNIGQILECNYGDYQHDENAMAITRGTQAYWLPISHFSSACPIRKSVIGQKRSVVPTKFWTIQRAT
ncbi:hypothetical protein OKW09_003065 [Pseudomonas rhodesiae]|nr:hypothetical protein [Pseudomonas rhodesiae]MDF9770780.1 hypothetical protein [Pseudomonas rhodesiae]